MEIKIHTHIMGGKPSINRSKITEAFEKFEGKNITIRITRKKDQRSTSANAYYWGVVIKMIKMAIEEQTGDVVDVGDVHEMLKGRFNTETIHGSFNRPCSVPKSTAGLSSWAFAKYVDQCRMWANDFFDIEIPDPDEDITGKIDDDYEPNK